ncbi:MAG: type II toxin-antitoxin system RelE/ParE family toxin [Pusillimonas sp.]
MTHKPVLARARAAQDVQDALAYYLTEASEKIAIGLLTELEQAYTHLSRFPEAGSNRYAYELNLPGLRAWPISSYPYVIFYMVVADHIDVWRVLHSKRDIPSWLSDTTSPGS